MQKRVMLTLTKENVERFQAVCRQIGLPPSTLSKACDDFIKESVGTLEKCVARGSVSIRDFFDMLGEQMEQLQDEERERKNAVKTPKAKKMAK